MQVQLLIDIPAASRMSHLWVDLLTTFEGSSNSEQNLCTNGHISSPQPTAHGHGAPYATSGPVRCRTPQRHDPSHAFGVKSLAHQSRQIDSLSTCERWLTYAKFMSSYALQKVFSYAEDVFAYYNI